MSHRPTKSRARGRAARFDLEITYPVALYLRGGPYGADAFFAAVASGSRGKDPWRPVHSSGASRKGRDLAMRFPLRAEARRAALRVLDLGLRGVRVAILEEGADGELFRTPLRPRKKSR